MATHAANIVNGIVIGMDAKHRYQQHEGEDRAHHMETSKHYHDPEKIAAPADKTKVNRPVEPLKAPEHARPAGAAKPRSDPQWMADRKAHQGPELGSPKLPPSESTWKRLTSGTSRASGRSRHDREEIGHALEMPYDLEKKHAAPAPKPPGAQRWNAYHDDVEEGVEKCHVSQTMDMLKSMGSGSDRPAKRSSGDSSWFLTASLPPPVKPQTFFDARCFQDMHSHLCMKLVGIVTFAVFVGLLAIYLLAFAGDKEHCSPVVVHEENHMATRGPPSGINPCMGKKPTEGFDNFACFQNGLVVALEQAGSNVTKGYKGELHTDAVPITDPFFKQGLCPVNVHWHVGTEHLSIGEYDERGAGPPAPRRLYGAAHEARLGFQCSLYNPSDPKFTKPFEWKHCLEMQVGQTYEVHWPHSRAGKCGTVNQYQTPFYDGVLCDDEVVAGVFDPNDARTTFNSFGVQSQVYVVVNDERYYYPDLFHGMIVDGEYGADVAYYTGSTTGTSRNNEMCSAYSPITWQVDRKCHLISASSFDKMCADMMMQRDDMTEDMYPHGSRELVLDELAADNHVRRRLT